MAQAQALLRKDTPAETRQLALYDVPGMRRAPARARLDTQDRHTRLCAGCRAKEARYGFRPEGIEAAAAERPRTLCFECFRAEIDRRRQVAEQLARGWNASQVGLPLEDTLNELSLRRRRAQIAARHALASAEAGF